MNAAARCTAPVAPAGLRTRTGARAPVATHALDTKSAGPVEYAKGFADTLSNKLTAPKVSEFEPEALIKELTDSEQLGKRGELWFVGQVALALAVFVPLVDLGWATRLLGLGSMGLGVAILIAGSNGLGASLTPLPVPREDGKLVTDGMFAYMRHPLYTGIFLTAAGFASATQDSTRVLLATALLVLLSYKAEFEENELEKKFGSEYTEYKKGVKRFWFL